MPDGGLAEHEALRERELAARLPLDEIPRDRERPSAEADDCLIGLQRRAHEPHRLEHRCECLLGVGHAQPLDVRHRADRLVDHGPDALDEPDVDAHPEHRGHDVREHHRRVDVVSAHRLQGDLRTQLGRMSDIEERVLLADSAIFRKRPARLAHEPHRGPLDFLAPRGAHEKRLSHLGDLVSTGSASGAVMHQGACSTRAASRLVALMTSAADMIRRVQGRIQACSPVLIKPLE